MLVKFFISGLLLLNFEPTAAKLAEVIDLTWDLSNETIYWPTTKPFSYTKIVATVSERGYWYADNEFCSSEHGGTHLDAPYHFFKEGWKVSQIPVTRLIAKGATIDLSQNNTEALLPQHLEDWVRTNGKFENNTVLLIKFGWSKYWDNRTEYLGLDEDANLHFPGISSEAATWIAESGIIVGVGVDTSSVDPGASLDMMAHRILSKNQIYNLENVKMLLDLPAKGFTVVALPTKLKHGTGAPLRLLAVPKGFF